MPSTREVVIPGSAYVGGEWDEMGMVETLLEQNQSLSETIDELSLAREDVGWNRMLAGEGDVEDYNRDGLRAITSRARLYARRDPNIKQAIRVQCNYVWAQDFSINARDARVQEVIDRFMSDKKNQSEITSHSARILKERELQIAGNLFFAFFVNEKSGRVRVRSFPFEQVSTIYFNPEDQREPWYYLREWSVRKVGDKFGMESVEKRKRWYPDWRYSTVHPESLGGIPVENVPIYHVKVGADDFSKFGLSEVHAALDWARAYKEFLTDWAALTKALARFAWKATVKGGQQAVNTAKGKLGRDPASALATQQNRTVAGGIAVVSDGDTSGFNLEPIPKAGAQPKAEDGRRLLLMIAAAVGLPETFFGDVSVGTLATAESLDRPTELRFVDRQALWRDIWNDILEFVVDKAMEAGKLPGTFEEDIDTEEEGDGRWILAAPEPEPGQEPVDEGDRGIDITFPPILQHSQLEAVQAAVAAVTLNGSTLNDTVWTPQLAARTLLQAAGIEDIDAALKEIFPVDETGKPMLREDDEARAELSAAAALKKAKLSGNDPTAKPPAPGGPPNGPPQNVAEALADAAAALAESVAEIRVYLEELRAA